jgi:hypothetical protein
MHPIQDLFLEIFSYVLQFDMHFYMHSYVDKNLILAKSGCYSRASVTRWMVEIAPMKWYVQDLIVDVHGAMNGSKHLIGRWRCAEAKHRCHWGTSLELRQGELHGAVVGAFQCKTERRCEGFLPDGPRWRVRLLEC